LSCGYPRFMYHPYVVRVMESALELDASLNAEGRVADQGESWDCIILPSRRAAMRCHDFLVKACGYLDGETASARFVDEHDGQCIGTIVGNVRIPLFSSDNAIDNEARSRVQKIGDQNIYNNKSPIRVLDLDAAEVHAVIFPAQTAFAIEAKSYWQHTGELVSSRRAECALLKLSSISESNEGNFQRKETTDADEKENFRLTAKFYGNRQIETTDKWNNCTLTDQPYLTLHPSHDSSFKKNDAFKEIKNHIASISSTLPENIFLTTSGMSSIYVALRSSRRRNLISTTKASLPMSTKYASSGAGTSIVYGFPYLDTLKMCSRPEFVPDGVEFFGHGNKDDLQNLTQMLEQRAQANGGKAGISVLMTEYPSNPLLNCPDLHALRNLADKYDFALVVDDTIGNFANLDLLSTGIADALCTSLTKLYNGRGDAIAGSVITNPYTKVGRWMQKDLANHHINHEGLWEGDARAIKSNSVDFLQRSSKINGTAESLADWLQNHEDVATVYYPKFTCNEGYKSLLNNNESLKNKHRAGYGGLLSILLHSHVCQRTFYDNLDVAKGPSLGTNFTLVCPYTLLAHFHELDFATSYNVQPNLLRIAVGLDDIDVLKNKFQHAFHEGRLHPKIPLEARSSTDSNLGENITSRKFCTLRVNRHPVDVAYTLTHHLKSSISQYQTLNNGLRGNTSAFSLTNYRRHHYRPSSILVTPTTESTRPLNSVLKKDVKMTVRPMIQNLFSVIIRKKCGR